MKIPEHWTFDGPEIAASFGEHVREQLPWYDLVTFGVAQIGRHYIPEHGVVYDIGASTGNVGSALADTLDHRRAVLIGLEPSPEMVERYAGPGLIEPFRAEEYEFKPFDFAVSMLALMFVPPAEVAGLLDRLVEKIRPGGALVVVERVIPRPGYLGLVSTRLSLAAKVAAGASGQEIVAKDLSLAGVQRPLEPEMLTDRGGVEWFRFGDFAGYVIEGPAA